MNLSKTSQKILTVFFARPGQKFYVNELIRQTGLYPNSVQQSLKTLTKQKILLSFRRGRFKFYHLNKSYKFLPQVRVIMGKQQKRRSPERMDPNWVKILNRQTSIPSQLLFVSPM